MQDDAARIETALEAALARAAAGAPPLLGAAMRHAVFPGGARVRPRLSLAVAQACGQDAPALAEAAAVSVELMHCASLVHDDLPCFDNAAERRGQPSVHARFGQPLAVLVGDALLAAAFETLAASPAAAARPERVVRLLAALGGGVGAPLGVIAGQAWESEPAVPLEAYHTSKTGALFVAAVSGGALAAGADPEPWRLVGLRLGQAYQLADDLLDLQADAEGCGKPVGQDLANGRPNAARALGPRLALERLERLTEAAALAVPLCPGAEALRALVRAQARRLAPPPKRRTGPPKPAPRAKVRA